MKVHFVTSGFPDGFPDEFIGELKRYLSLQNRLTFVASDFAAHEKAKKYAGMFARWFAEKGVDFGEVFIVDNEVSPEKAREFVETANVVWLSGGPTLAQMESIRRYGLIPALCARDGITIGMSAGAINMAKKVVLAKDLSDNVPELSVYEGIGLGDFNIEPHIHSASREHLEKDVAEAAKVSPIIGLPDDSFIVDTEGSFRIFGPYTIYS